MKLPTDTPRRSLTSTNNKSLRKPTIQQYPLAYQRRAPLKPPRPTLKTISQQIRIYQNFNVASCFKYDFIYAEFAQCIYILCLPTRFSHSMTPPPTPNKLFYPTYNDLYNLWSIYAVKNCKDNVWCILAQTSIQEIWCAMIHLRLQKFYTQCCRWKGCPWKSANILKTRIPNLDRGWNLLGTLNGLKLCEFGATKKFEIEKKGNASVRWWIYFVYIYSKRCI